MIIVGFTRFSEIKKLLFAEEHNGSITNEFSQLNDAKISEMQILFQGQNLPNDPWFNELELSSDFISPMNRDSIIEVINIINKLAVWPKCWVFSNSLLSYIFSILKITILTYYRKQITQKIENYLNFFNKNGNNHWLMFSFWTNRDYSSACLLLIHKQKPKNPNLKVFSMPISGYCNLEFPLKLELNNIELLTCMKIKEEKYSEKN